LFIAVLTCIQPDLCLFEVLIYGHFRSRDKDGGCIIQSAIAETPMLPANITVLSSTELELLPIEVFQFSQCKFCVFAKNIGRYKI